MDVSRAHIDLAVEEVVLHGFESIDGPLVGRLLERELTRVIRQRGMPATLSRGGERPLLEPLSFQLERGAGAERLASQVARALHGGLGR